MFKTEILTLKILKVMYGMSGVAIKTANTVMGHGDDWYLLNIVKPNTRLSSV